MLPKLRKQNYNLENDNNTILQRHFYDFIYDSQDLFDYYDEYLGDFDDQNNNTPLEELVFKTDDLPFENLLKSFYEIADEFTNSDSVETIYNYRHYLNILNDSNEINNKTNGKITSEDQNLSEIIEGVNPIIFVLRSLHNTCKNFCQLSLKLIKIHNKDNAYSIDNDMAFLKEYSLKFNQYVESSIQINDYLENFVVIINYLYTYCFPNEEGDEMTPKFSVLRMMLVCWNKYVLEELSEELKLKGEKLFETALEEVIEPELVNSKQKEQNEIHSFFRGPIQSNKNSTITCCFSNTSNIDRDIMSESTDISNESYLSNNHFGLNNENQSQVHSEKTNTFKSLNSSLLDNSANEFSVMLLNSDSMIYDGMYKSFEDDIVSKLETILIKYSEKSSLWLFNTISNLAFIQNVFSNTLLHKLNKKLSGVINEIAGEKIFQKFIAYVDSTISNKTNNKNFNKSSFGSEDEQWIKFIAASLLTKLNNKNIYGFSEEYSNFLIISFIKQNLKDDDFTAIKESFKWICDKQITINYFNKVVGQELKRKIPNKNIKNLINTFGLNKKLKLAKKAEESSMEQSFNKLNLSKYNFSDDSLCLVSSGSGI